MVLEGESEGIMSKDEFGISSFDNKVTGWWEIDVGILYKEGREVFDVQDTIDAIVGHQSHSSGAGFGYRDLQYAVSRRRRKEVVREIEAELDIGKDKDYVGVYHQQPTWLWRFIDWLDRKGIKSY